MVKIAPCSYFFFLMLIEQCGHAIGKAIEAYSPASLTSAAVTGTHVIS